MKFASAILFCVLGVSSLEGATSSELKSVQRRIERTKQELGDLRQSQKDIEQIETDLETDLVKDERDFRWQFSKIIAPLLHWPPYSLTTRVKTWIEREHGRIVLEETKARLIKEPLILIADREMNLDKVNRVQAELETKIQKLENRETFLNLQLEELRILQKRVPIKKSKSN